MLVDANVLLYAVNSDSAWHEESKNWLDEALGGTEPVGFAWVVLLAFLRLSTHQTVLEHPLEIEVAVPIVEGWLGQPAAVVVQPSARHVTLLGGLLSGVGTAANLVNDAHLGALALEHNATVITFDTDFSRFQGVRSRRPAA